MGRFEDGSVIIHFCHEHPLNLQQLQADQIPTKTTCPACNQSVCGSQFYSCATCNFHLHKKCSNLPRNLKHKIDQQHDLTLLSSPPYPEGVFKCNACGSQGKGFSYHCPDCQLDLHVDCAFMPLSIPHVSHAHSLSLCFESPYENQPFSCDICKEPGLNQWLYRCEICEFDAHIKCAKASTTATSRSVLPKSTSLPHHPSPPPPSPTPAPPPAPIQMYHPLPASQYPQVLPRSASLPSYGTHHFAPPPQYPTPRPQPPPFRPYYSGQTAQYQHPQPQMISHYQAPPPMPVPQYAQAAKPSGQTSNLVNAVAGHVVVGIVGSVVEAFIG
ncbi:hypothetical protein LXL04_007037 [Taraxacum kok-saghyz]